MSNKVWINGQYFDKLDAKVSVYDHGFLYGDGIFEGIRIYGGKVFKHQEHIDRLFNSEHIFQMKMPWDRQTVANACREVVKANGLESCYIRPLTWIGSERTTRLPMRATGCTPRRGWPGRTGVSSGGT